MGLTKKKQPELPSSADSRQRSPCNRTLLQLSTICYLLMSCVPVARSRTVVAHPHAYALSRSLPSYCTHKCDRASVGLPYRHQENRAIKKERACLEHEILLALGAMDDGRMTDLQTRARRRSSYSSVYEVLGERKPAGARHDPVIAHDAPGDGYRVGAAVARYPPGTRVLAPRRTAAGRCAPRTRSARATGFVPNEATARFCADTPALLKCCAWRLNPRRRCAPRPRRMLNATDHSRRHALRDIRTPGATRR